MKEEQFFCLFINLISLVFVEILKWDIAWSPLFKEELSCLLCYVLRQLNSPARFTSLGSQKCSEGENQNSMKGQTEKQLRFVESIFDYKHKTRIIILIMTNKYIWYKIFTRDKKVMIYLPWHCVSIELKFDCKSLYLWEISKGWLL